MQTRSAVAQRVAFTGAAQRLTPADLGALTRAVQVAAVTVAADPHLLGAAPATVEPIRLLACPHAPRAQHWTTPHSAGIKATRTRPYAREHVEGPGFFQERARAFAYSASGNRIARVRPLDACGGIRIGHIATAASMYDCVLFNQTISCATRRSNSKPNTGANSAVNDFGDVAPKPQNPAPPQPCLHSRSMICRKRKKRHAGKRKVLGERSPAAPTRHRSW